MHESARHLLRKLSLGDFAGLVEVVVSLGVVLGDEVVKDPARGGLRVPVADRIENGIRKRRSILVVGESANQLIVRQLSGDLLTFAT